MNCAEDIAVDSELACSVGLEDRELVGLCTYDFRPFYSIIFDGEAVGLYIIVYDRDIDKVTPIDRHLGP